MFVDVVKSIIFATHYWAINSVGSECLPYKEEVGGSSPSLPTPVKQKPLIINDIQGFFLLCCQICCRLNTTTHSHPTS